MNSSEQSWQPFLASCIPVSEFPHLPKLSCGLACTMSLSRHMAKMSECNSASCTCHWARTDNPASISCGRLLQVCFCSQHDKSSFTFISEIPWMKFESNKGSLHQLRIKCPSLDWGMCTLICNTSGFSRQAWCHAHETGVQGAAAGHCMDGLQNFKNVLEPLDIEHLGRPGCLKLSGI